MNIIAVPYISPGGSTKADCSAWACWTGSRKHCSGNAAQVNISQQKKMTFWDLLCGDCQNVNGLLPTCPAFIIISAQVLHILLSWAFLVAPAVPPAAVSHWLWLCQWEYIRLLQERREEKGITFSSSVARKGCVSQSVPIGEEFSWDCVVQRSLFTLYGKCYPAVRLLALLLCS